ncbi:MAG: hypothetical protein KDA69_18325, partial [Planctomycetaceae bacterium]|nr:hypothetical protein [Planctomycetaceae bacterium]
QLLDGDLADLLLALAQRNPGLCLLTSRQAVKELDGLHGRASEQKDLEELAKPVAVELLRKLQVTGSDEDLEHACDQFGCHALSLTLLGRFLFDVHGGDVRRVDRIRDLERADQLTREDRHRTVWKVLQAYEEWLASATSADQPKTLAVLRLMGLFDRRATPDCLSALRAEPAIPGLTEALVEMADDEWAILLQKLARARLLKLDIPEHQPEQISIDAHPLIREYFAQQLKKEQPEAFRAAHSRLFDHLCETTKPHQPDTLLGLQPLYEAVTHGCLAGRHQEACDKVYVDRILRGMESDGFYSTRQLGAIGADLGAVAAFFDVPWSQVSQNLKESDQAWLLSQAAFRLRALGRLTEALEPMRSALEMAINAKNWKSAAVRASNLSELEVTLGQLPQAVTDGRRAVDFADLSGEEFHRVSKRATAADALHQSGATAEARHLFADAETMQTKMQPDYPLLYSTRGFRYVDLLLAPAEQAAWQVLLDEASKSEFLNAQRSSLNEICKDADQRGQYALDIVMSGSRNLLDIALNHLTLTRSALYRALFSGDVPKTLATQVTTALSALRKANTVDHLPKTLLTAAWYYATLGEQPDEAKRLLEETEQIAKRGPMPLYLADVHLHRARLFRDRAEL